MFEIIDDKGVIYSGDEEDMEEQFQLMATDEEGKYEWSGDLKLVEVKRVIR